MNANDSMRHHTGSMEQYKYNFGTVITEGIKDLADTFECYWFLDIIASYQGELKCEEFQVWKLKKMDDDSALVTCEDGNDKQLKSQVIDYTDFRADEATVWVEFGTMLLPSEH